MARSRRLYVVNASDVVTDREARAIVRACNRQVAEHAAPAWGLNRVVVEFHAGRDLESVQAAVPASSWVLALIDDPDDPGALGYHSVDEQDRVYLKVFTKPSLTDGESGVLDGPYAVSATASHEVLETLGDPFCTGYNDTGRGYLVASELADAVEADGYEIDGVRVSNFVLPPWFDSSAKPGAQFDWLGRLTLPFSMSPGGYWVQMRGANATQSFKRLGSWLSDTGFDVEGEGDLQVVFSPEMPEWRRDVKRAHGRNLLKRRVAE